MWDLPDVGGNDVWNLWTSRQASSLKYWYQQWQSRDITVDELASGGYIIEVGLAGRLDGSDLPPPGRANPELYYTDQANDGVVKEVREWLASHFTGAITQDWADENHWLLDCTPVNGVFGRFVPSGGQEPRSLTIPS